MTHILTIDDEEDIREILAQSLMANGFRVTAVGSAEEAMQVMRTDPPQLVVTDLQLEETDGFAVIDEVKRIAPQTPVVLLTGVLFDPAVTERISTSKISGYVPKTAPLDRILAEIRRHLG